MENTHTSTYIHMYFKYVLLLIFNTKSSTFVYFFLLFSFLLQFNYFCHFFFMQVCVNVQKIYIFFLFSQYCYQVIHSGMIFQLSNWGAPSKLSKYVLKVRFQTEFFACFVVLTLHKSKGFFETSSFNVVICNILHHLFYAFCKMAS